MQVNEHGRLGNSPLRIPDHELLRPIGHGSYGEVWLARNTSTGAYRAIKAVWRCSFEQNKPFEREFAGLRKFEPVSRSHPGLMAVLHVGRDDGEGLFYAVMELADDVRTGQEIIPTAYAPKTLRREIQTRGRLPSEECVELGVSLAQALGKLHEQGLVHRDIKPSNIIFINGRPKLADIGLVTDLDATCSFVGTDGYVPHEGPGSPQADIYALGKVLYEAVTGQDRTDYPQLPANLKTFPDYQGLMEVNEVIVKACEWSPAARYPSAEAMLADLEHLKNGNSVRHKRRLEQRRSRWKKVGSLALAVVAIGAGAILSLNAIFGQRDPVFLEVSGHHLEARSHPLWTKELEGKVGSWKPLDLDNHGHREFVVQSTGNHCHPVKRDGVYWKDLHMSGLHNKNDVIDFDFVWRFFAARMVPNSPNACRKADFLSSHGLDSWRTISPLRQPLRRQLSDS